MAVEMLAGWLLDCSHYRWNFIQGGSMGIVPLASSYQAMAAAFASTRECAYCQSPIASGERWVREKICEPPAANGPHYRRYHADLVGEEVLSCWEKHQMQQQTENAAVGPESQR